jgi:hypothetical protein
MPGLAPGLLFASQTQRQLAALTGGLYNGFSASATTLAAIDESSRFAYLLGYVPSNGALDSSFRRITVKVNRPGARVLSRHGYYARRENIPFDRKQFMTDSRIAGAANTAGLMTDLLVSAAAAYDAQAGEADLTISLKADRVAFEARDGRHMASVQFALFAGDGKQRLLGQHWQVMNLDLTKANYQVFLDKGVSFTLRIPVETGLKFVKIVAYDYAADRLGTAVVTIGERR